MVSQIFFMGCGEDPRGTTRRTVGPNCKCILCDSEAVSAVPGPEPCVAATSSICLRCSRSSEPSGSARACRSHPASCRRSCPTGRSGSWSSDLSEPGGYFRSDNLVSNETAFQHVIPDLVGADPARRRLSRASAPIRTSPTSRRCSPRMAFIIDIRAAEPAAAPDVQGADRDVGRSRRLPVAPVLAAATARARTRPRRRRAVRRLRRRDAERRRSIRSNLQAIFDRLTKHARLRAHRLTTEQASSTSTARSSERPRPALLVSAQRSAAQVVSDVRRADAADRRVRATNHSYMASDENFRRSASSSGATCSCRSSAISAAPRRIRAVGAYLRDHDATVTYVLHVERRAVPVPKRRLAAASSPTSRRSRSTSQHVHPRVLQHGIPISRRRRQPEPQSATLLDPISSEVSAFKAGEIQTYYDVVERYAVSSRI